MHPEHRGAGEMPTVRRPTLANPIGAFFNGLLGLPDMQCHFRGLDPGAVGALLYATAHHIYENGDTILDGDTTQGVTPRDRWECRHEVSLVEPRRPVIDVRPDGPHAGGGRE